MPVISIRQFSPLMRQSVKIAPRSDYDDDGAASYGADVTYRCAVVGETKMVRNERGQEVPSRQSVYLMSNAPVRPEDRITLSTGDAGSTESYAINPRIVRVARYPFTAGQFLTEVNLE